MSKSWDELRNEYLRVCEMSCEPVNIKKVPLGYIFDEDMICGEGLIYDKLL